MTGADPTAAAETTTTPSSWNNEQYSPEAVQIVLLIHYLPGKNPGTACELNVPDLDIINHIAYGFPIKLFFNV